MRYIMKKHVDFDSLEYSKELVEAGLPPKVADLLSARKFHDTEEQNRELFENLATRDDLEKVRLALKSDMDKLRLELKSDMKSLIIKFGAMMVASTAITIAALSLILHA